MAGFAIEPALFGLLASDPHGVAAGGDPGQGRDPRDESDLLCRSRRSRPRLDVDRDDAPDADGQVTAGIDRVLVLAHSDKQDATAT